MAAIRMSVKNTFVHVDDEDQEITGAVPAMASRRSSSVPRSLRLWNSFEDITPKKVDDDGVNRAPSSCAEVSTEAELSEVDNESYGSTPPPSPSASGRLPKRQISIMVEGASAGPPPAFLAMAMIPMVSPAAASEPERPRARLNSKAQAWTPGASTSAPKTPSMPYASGSAMMGAFSQHLTLLLATTVAAIRRVPGMGSVQAAPESSGAAGWKIQINMSLENFEKRRDQAIAVAKHGLAMAVGATAGVHLVGAMGDPFSATPMGCTATLATVADENQACWDSLAHGFCPRGHSCRWQHPVCRTSVNIIVKIADEAC
eukprot:CAMPEP_0170229322 /NCGR_PEP_ID=MMETSP0116_2-20130129/14385_1 /TAXON_ID=400756 /ORGANISM="Durinskia baltica, Strain CSIRO CS-38" /LENGTH=315 /DNA_ID=CAMNT_0010480073 /DNA_START=44 /DNA_END=991 /DNA_ORIENTATION=+